MQLLVPFVMVLLMVYSSDVTGYPDRVPVYEFPEICDTMDPFGHDTIAQNETANPMPYKFVFSTAGCYSDQPVFVTVYHPDVGGYFHGFFLVARIIGGTNESFGTFDNNGDIRFTPYSCGGSVNNTFGHGAKIRINETTFTWTAPPGFDSDIQFVATMVRSTHTYWMNVAPAPLYYSAICSDLSANSTTTTTKTTTITRSNQTDITDKATPLTPSTFWILLVTALLLLILKEF